MLKWLVQALAHGHKQDNKTLELSVPGVAWRQHAKDASGMPTISRLCFL